MCGRYVSPDVAEAERNLLVHLRHWQEYERSYNVAPTQAVPVVRAREGQREGLRMRWGLIPFFCRGIAPKYSTINATIEKLATGPCWRGPWGRGQRCILPAVGFYEWQVQPDGSKQPYFIHLADQTIFGFAGLWDRSTAADGAETLSCTIITLPASPLMASIHNSQKREPAILSEGDREAWLSGSAAEALAALRPYADEQLVAYPVSRRVNSPRNNDAALIAPQAGALF